MKRADAYAAYKVLNTHGLIPGSPEAYAAFKEEWGRVAGRRCSMSEELIDKALSDYLSHLKGA